MKHVKLNNKSYVVYTTTGMKTFDKTHLNYKKLVVALKSDDEKEFIELLKTPPTPNGIFTAYINNLTDKLVYSITNNNNCRYFNIDKSNYDEVGALEFIGVYTSLEELYEDNPSYLI